MVMLSNLMSGNIAVKVDGDDDVGEPSCPARSTRGSDRRRAQLQPEDLGIMISD
jgi:hypothetical protein